MSDRDEATGQFAAEAPQYFGREGIEREAGYVPLQDDTKPEEPGELTLAEAREQLDQQLASTPESEVRSYVSGIELADNVTMTPEQGYKALSDMEAADKAQADQAQTEALQKEIDELRGVKEEAKPQFTQDDPKFKEAVAIEAANHAKEADEVKQKYSAAIENADQIASAAFRARFPELAAQPVEQWQNALATMPTERAQEAIGTLQHLMQVKAALQQQQSQQAEAERTRFKAANERLEEKIKDVPKERRAAAENEIVALLQENGSDLKGAADFLRGLQGSDVAMGLLWELGDTRAQLKAIRNAPKALAARNQLPPVQRPGTTMPRQSSADASIAALDRRLSQTGSEKDAWALFEARQRARG